MSYTVYKFYADWCGPCKTLSTMMESIETPHTVKAIDVDSNEELAKKFHIRGIPTLIMVDEKDEVIKTKVGLPSKTDLADFLQN